MYLASGHGYSTRGATSGHIILPASRLNFRKLTVIDTSVALWNSLLKDIISTVNNKITFKKHPKK